MSIKQTILILMAAVMTACSDTPKQPETPALADGEVGIRLLTGSRAVAGTGSTLKGPDDIQHAKTVYVYVFSGVDDTCKCVFAGDVNWKFDDAVSGGPEREQYYRIKYGFKQFKRYRVVGIGMDSKAADVYNISATKECFPTFAAMRLKFSSSSTIDDLRHTEWFAGELIIDTTEGVGGLNDLTLYRRVAGVMGYFTNIPSTYKNKAVKRLRVTLYKALNTDGYVLPKTDRSAPDKYLDYITSPLGGKETTAANTYIIDYELGSADYGAVTVSVGSYMPAVPAPYATVADATASKIMKEADAAAYVNTHTLRVQLIAEDGTALRTMLVVDDELMENQRSDPGRFAICNNHFYSLGTEAEPVDFGVDKDIVVVGTYQADIDIVI